MTRLLVLLWSILVTPVILVIMLPFVLIAEIWMRITYRRPWFAPPSLWARLRAKGTDPEPAVTYATNAFNAWDCRDREFSSDVASGTIRVLVLGDSFTEGWGVADSERTFCKELERRLCAMGQASNVHFEVLNGGWNGSLTSHWVDRYRFLRDSFRPDIVLAVFYTRDGTFIGSIPAFFDRIRDSMRAEIGIGYRLSALLRAQQDADISARLTNRYLSAFLDSYLGSPAQRIEWRVAQSNLVVLRDLVEAAGSKLILVNFPTLVRLDDRHPFRRIYGEIEGFANRSTIPYLDLLPVFMGHQARGLWVADDDQHPNEAAHEMVGGYLASALWTASEQLRDVVTAEVAPPAPTSRP